MIETKRLMMRPLKESDAADVFEYLREPAVNCFASIKLDSIEEAQERLKNQGDEADYNFAIVLKETGKVIGEIGAYPDASENHDETAPVDTFSPMWMLNEAYQGHGYAYEAAYAVFDYMFKSKGARRLYAYTEDYNLASQHLCVKLGMRQEGIFKEFVSFVNQPDGTPLYENTLQYAILKSEWEVGEVNRMKLVENISSFDETSEAEYLIKTTFVEESELVKALDDIENNRTDIFQSIEDLMTDLKSNS